MNYLRIYYRPAPADPDFYPQGEYGNVIYTDTYDNQYTAEVFQDPEIGVSSYCIDMELDENYQLALHELENHIDDNFTALPYMDMTEDDDPLYRFQMWRIYYANSSSEEYLGDETNDFKLYLLDPDISSGNSRNTNGFSLFDPSYIDLSQFTEYHQGADTFYYIIVEGVFISTIAPQTVEVITTMNDSRWGTINPPGTNTFDIDVNPDIEISANPNNGYALGRLVIEKYKNNVLQETLKYDKTTTFYYQFNYEEADKIIATAYFMQKTSANSEWTVSSDDISGKFYTPGNVVYNFSTNLYRTGVKYYATHIRTTDGLVINDPHELTARITTVSINDLYNFLRSNPTTFHTRLTQDFSNVSDANLTNLYYLTDNNNIRYWTGGVYLLETTLDLSFSSITIGSKFNNITLAGWSTITGTYTTDWRTAYHNPIHAAEITYSGMPESEDYPSGTGYTYNDISKTGSETFSFTIARSADSVNNGQITVKVTDTFSGSASKTVNVGKIYGWSQPLYTVSSVSRTNDQGEVESDLDRNNCIKIDFLLNFSSIIVDDVDLNAIDPTNLSRYIQIEYNGTYPTTTLSYDSTSNLYTAIVKGNFEFDINYLLKVKIKDNVIYSYSSDAIEYEQRSNSGIPLSLNSDDSNRIGVGFGQQATNPGQITFGMNTVFDTGTTLNSSMIVGSEQFSSSIDAYNLLKRGGEYSVAISEQDYRKNQYVNNLRVVSKAEFEAITTRDEHTMYLIKRNRQV